MKVSTLIAVSLGAALVAAMPAPGTANTITEGPYPGFSEDDGTGLFVPEAEAIGVEIFDLAAPLPGVESSFGFYLGSDPNTLVTIFSPADQAADPQTPDQVALIDVWAPWCGPCRMVAPIVDRIAADHAGDLIVAKVNTDEHPMWAGKFGVQGIPTMLFIAGGHVLDTQVGAAPAPYLRDAVEQFLELANEGVAH